MRGRSSSQETMFVMINVEASIPDNHPLRGIKTRCDSILKAMSRDFSGAYSHTGRPSIPPEQLLKAMLLQALYSIKSEMHLMQAIQFNLLYRWFLDIPGDRDAWTPEVFCVNRQRFSEHGLVRKFFDRVVAEAIAENLVSSDHFTVDGTLIRSWASLKSLRPKDALDQSHHDDDDKGNPQVNFHGQKRTNQTHASYTDSEAMLARKGPGKEAHLSHSGHILMENRHGLCVDVDMDAADGRAERRNAVRMLERTKRRHEIEPETLGADAGYDAGEFICTIERMGITPHIAIKQHKTVVSDDEGGQARRRALKRSGTREYEISQRIRKRVEEVIGWFKVTGGLARFRLVGRWKNLMQMLMTASAYDLLRMTKLLARA
jgi:transposase